MSNLATDCYRRLGFVIRNARDFDNAFVVKIVFTTLVRSKLEAASIVWNPHEVTYALLLEKIQKTFLILKNLWVLSLPLPDKIFAWNFGF